MTLKDIFIKGDSEKMQINKWLNWLSKFDLKLFYRPFKTNQHIKIADGLSWMLVCYLMLASDYLKKKLSMRTFHAQSHLF